MRFVILAPVLLILAAAAGCVADPFAGRTVESLAAESVPETAGSSPAPPYRIVPVRPLDEARAIAAAARPPVDPAADLAPALVDVGRAEPGLKLDLRYATADNFMGAPLYRTARAFLRAPAAEALVRAHRRLVAHGYGIVVFDAYRPWSVTKTFWEASGEADRAFLGDPAEGSRHNRGAAVDVGLYDRADGKILAMPSAFDEFTPRAAADYPGGTPAERRRRALLRRAMEDEGFVVLPNEWWHFDYRDWRRYPVLNVPLESAEGAKTPD